MTDRLVKTFTRKKGRINEFEETVGSMLQQDADAVAITGGTIDGVILDGAALGTMAQQASTAVAITGGDISETTNLSIEIGVVAAGSVAGDATTVTKQLVVVATTALNTGIIIPDAALGKEMFIFNQGANALDVYPATGDMINGAAVLIVAIGGAVVLKAVDATDWYSIS